MKNQPEHNQLPASINEYRPYPFADQDIISALVKNEAFKSLLQQNGLLQLDTLLTRLPEPAGKKSFLVFKNNKYFTVPTESIALFSVEYESTLMTCFDGGQYAVSHSLEQIQHMLTGKHFFRLNRQYLVNFDAVKDVEHYFERKLFVRLIVPVQDKLLVSKEKASAFLQWLEER